MDSRIRRKRWLAGIAIVSLGLAAWLFWPSSIDPRLVGTWRESDPTENWNLMWRFHADGRAEMWSTLKDGRLIYGPDQGVWRAKGDMIRVVESRWSQHLPVTMVSWLRKMGFNIRAFRQSIQIVSVEEQGAEIRHYGMGESLMWVREDD